MEMPIWKDNEIKRAFDNMVEAQTAFNKSPSIKTWGSFCDAYQTWAKLDDLASCEYNVDVLYSNKWIDSKDNI